MLLAVFREGKPAPNEENADRQRKACKREVEDCCVKHIVTSGDDPAISVSVQIPDAVPICPALRA
jgi:hypothetical protein